MILTLPSRNKRNEWHLAHVTTPLPSLCRQLNPIGSRALSHDSIFIPEESAKEPHLDHSMSQENVSDKVRNLQVRLAFGSPVFCLNPPDVNLHFFVNRSR